MRTNAVIIEEPGRLGIAPVTLHEMGACDVIVAVSHSGISTGTEKLLWQGRMPQFPGMGYPLVPGYEAVGTVVDRGAAATVAIGTRVFVPGATCFADVRALFGAAAATLVVPESRIVANDLGDERGVLLALAATAHHALAAPGAALPDLIVGHGTVGRLLARIALAKGGSPVVWETAPERRGGATGYAVTDAAGDPRRDYHAIYDCSGDATIVDQLVGRLAKGGEIVLAGFYADRIGFAFAPAFMREARLRIAAEWTAADMAAVNALLADGLSFDGLVTDHAPAADAPAAYARAFTAPGCLKMVLDWRTS